MPVKKTTRTKSSWKEFEGLCTKLRQMYGLTLEVITWLLLGFHSNRSTLRKERNWESEQHQELLRRMREYISNPGLILMDLFWFLYGKDNLPAPLKGYVHEGADSSGFFSDLDPFIQTYYGEDSKKSLDSILDKSPNSHEQQFMKAIKRIYFLFNKHYDEKHGGLRDEVTTYQRILNAFNKQCSDMFNQLSQASDQLLAEMVVQNAPVDPENADFREICNTLRADVLKELSDKVSFFNLYAVTPKINEIAWANTDLFKLILSQKLTSFYYWNALDSSNDVQRDLGKEQVKPIQSFLKTYCWDLHGKGTPDSEDGKEAGLS